MAQGEGVAEQERRRLGIGNAPVADASRLIASQGIWASGVTFPDGMSGLFLRHSSIGLAIPVNSSHAKERRRFSYAHEYAHALPDRNGIVTISGTVNSSELVEKCANAFAAAFLMPQGGIRISLQDLDEGLPSRQDHAVFDAASAGQIEAAQRKSAHSQRITYKDNTLLSRHFGESYQAAAYRLKSLRYISGRECGNLLDQEHFGCNYLDALSMFAEVGEGEEQRNRGRELRNEIAHLTIEVYRREEISRGRILELSKSLRIAGDTLLNLSEAARGDRHSLWESFSQRSSSPVMSPLKSVIAILIRGGAQPPLLVLMPLPKGRYWCCNTTPAMLDGYWDLHLPFFQPRHPLLPSDGPRPTEVR